MSKGGRREDPIRPVHPRSRPSAGRTQGRIRHRLLLWGALPPRETGRGSRLSGEPVSCDAVRRDRRVVRGGGRATSTRGTQNRSISGGLWAGMSSDPILGVRAATSPFPACVCPSDAASSRRVSNRLDGTTTDGSQSGSLLGVAQSTRRWDISGLSPSVPDSMRGMSHPRRSMGSASHDVDLV